MGMAASQARFLGLTARKSNVEYQGQQINQQRTALSNESANLYNQMLELTVPTPPSTNNFYKTTYVLEDSTASYAKSNYRIANATKTYNAENQYKVTLTNNVEKTQGLFDKLTFNSVKEEKTGDTVTGYTFDIAEYNKNLVYTIGELPETKDNNGNYSGKADNITNYHIYKAESKYNLDGYKTCCTDENETYYFYKDGNGKNYYLTSEQLEEMKAGNVTEKIQFAYENVYTVETSTEVLATLEKASSGRYSSIHIYEDDDYPELLSGNTFAVSTTQEMDQEAYDDAYNDYEYEKYKYEQAIQNINAQTEIIQNQDQQLELRLQQLNTEQDAIKTEMDSVSKVIQDNVEKTFKVFA